MSIARILAVALLVIAGPPGLNPAPAAEKERRVAHLLSQTTLVYFELRDPDQALGFVLDHPLVKRLLALPESKTALQANAQVAQFHKLLASFEQQTGQGWRDTLKQATAGGLVVAFDTAQKNGVAVIAQAADPAAAENFTRALVELAEKTPAPGSAEGEGKTIPVARGVYRGITGYKIGPMLMTSVDRLIILSNSESYSKALVDAQHTPPRKSLAEEPTFKTAWLAASERRAGWAYLKLKTLHDLGATQKLADKLDNPGAELLIGGLASVMQDADYVAGELTIDQRRLRLALAAPYDPAAIPKARKFYFAPAGEGAEAPLKPEGAIANITFYRDIGSMWNAGPDLFDEAAAAKMAQADTNLGNFFGGRSFSTDLLPQLNPRSQIILARQTFDSSDPAIPDLKLPAFAFVTSMEQPQSIFPLLKAGYQTIIGFANINAGQQGRPLFDVETAKRGPATIVSAAYIPSEVKDRNHAGMHYNFTPSLVLMDRRVMICSTRKLAEQLVDLASSRPAAGQIADNTLIQVEVPAILAGLKDNREPLIGQNMISKGNDRARSEREVDLLIDLLGCFRQLNIRLTPESHRITLSAEVMMTAPEASP